MKFEFSDVISLVCLVTICWFSCLNKNVERSRRACLALWTKLEEAQGFVICALLLGTTSDATSHDTMIFE